MSKTKKWIFWLLGIAAGLFYLIPFFLLAAGLSPEFTLGIQLLLLFLLNPAYSIVSGILFTWKRGFRWYLPFGTAAVFFPSIFLFSNSSAWIYAAGYFVLSFAGCGIGALLGRFFPSR